MTADQVLRDETLRIEALRQANLLACAIVSTKGPNQPSDVSVGKAAQLFFKFLKGEVE